MKCILTTGVNIGIGYESTKLLTFQGHQILSAFRKIDNLKNHFYKLQKP